MVMKSDINQVIENNIQINKLIEQIFQKRRSIRIPFEKDGKVDFQMEEILKLEIEKILGIYKLEFPNYKCQGKEGISFREKELADCFGGVDGLQVTYGIQTFIDKIIIPTMKKMGYQINAEGEIFFSANIKDNIEHEPNENAKPFGKYVGSVKDQMDYFALLMAKNGIDMDYIWDALAHEEMHTFGVDGGNKFLMEGTTEELTREISEKYQMHMSPHAHTQEANFIRKLELLVGRDKVIESGMWKGKFKEEHFANILEDNPQLNYSELSNMFELLKIAPEKLKSDELSQIKNFGDKNPQILNQIKETVDVYRKQEREGIRYQKVAEEFDKKLGMKSGSFLVYAELLEDMYKLTQIYKTDPKYYRQAYNLNFDDLKKIAKEDKSLDIIDSIKAKAEKLSKDNKMEITSFNDLMTPIDKAIEGKELETNDEPKDFSEVLKKQQEEIEKFNEIIKTQDIFLEQEMGKDTINSSTEAKENAQNNCNREMKSMREQKTKSDMEETL